MNLEYPIGTSGQVIRISAEVLEHFARHRQSRWWQREAGGQIFGRFENGAVRVESVSGPKVSDTRSRYSHASNRTIAQAEVDERHALGLHYLGDWHTHPERRPHPSWIDKVTMAGRVRRSKHQLGGFVFIIVGTCGFPAGLAVMVHDGTNLVRLTASDQRDTR